MTDPTDLRFFQALQAACRQVAGVDAVCAKAVDRAVETGAPNDMLAARRAVDELDTALRDSLLRQVHMHMATDLSAIWNALPGAPEKPRPN